MPDAIIIALAQMNAILGDVEGNSKKIAAIHADAAKQGADLVVYPELCISGYPPEDLVCRPAYIEACMEAAGKLAAQLAKGPAAIIGTPWKSGDGFGAKPYNAAALLQGGKVAQLWYKYDLPNYGIFDDKRIFNFGGLEQSKTFVLNDTQIGVAVCEDLWSKPVAAHLKKQGAQLIISINASPFESDKHYIRKAVIASRVKETGLPIVYLNQIGAQDEVVHDGDSFVMNAEGKICAWADCFEESLLITRWNQKGQALIPEESEVPDFMPEEESVYRALVLGLRDYLKKNGCDKALLGLSGGIDSALVAVMAVDAIGKDHVSAVMMPSPYTSKESLDDARQLAKNLGCDYRVIPIEPSMTAMNEAVDEHVKGFDADLMHQNIQSRLRGVTLMALSNATRAMVLACGNKSEMAVGYATLYGDTCGAFAPIKDVYKTLVYRLCRWRDQNRPADVLGPSGKIFPENILTRAPSAELKPGQKDVDSLPPYDKLDDILQCLIEREMSLPDIVSRGHAAATVQKVLRLLRFAEYKRRQVPPGTKITPRALGRDHRYPITNKFWK